MWLGVILLCVLVARTCSAEVDPSVLVRVTSCEITRDCSDSNDGTEWTCCNFQSALERVGQNNWSNRTVSVLVPAGNHLLQSPVHVGSTSVELIGAQSPTASPLTNIQCTYNIDVDQDQLFNLSYVYTDYSLYFNRSKSVSISNIAMSGCQFPLRLDTIGTVEISNSSFQFFREAVFDIFNSVDITLLRCVFFNNSGTGISRKSFRANTGAVSIGFNNIELDQHIENQPQIIISNCNFTRNQATARSFFRSTDTVFTDNIFSGRGGGLGIFINDSRYNITAMIYDNYFVSNYGRSYGGGLFIVIFGRNTQNMFFLKRNVFKDNLAELGAGGFLMTFNSAGFIEAPHTTIVSDCSFIGNSASSGGGILTSIANRIVSSVFILERSNFTGHRGLGLDTDIGSAYAMWLVDLRDRGLLPASFVIADCTFEGNSGTNGVVSLGYAPFAFLGKNAFIRNEGTSSLRIIGTLVDVYGSIEFLENKVADVAALELLSSSQIRLHSGAHMEFRKNVGRFGASILTSYDISLRALSSITFNPQCFILYEDRHIPPSDWANVSVVFRENKAVSSSSVYGSTFTACTWFSLKTPFFNPRSVLDWPLWDLGNDSKNSGYEDIFSQDHHIGTEAVAIQTFKSVTAWPGYYFKLNITGMDEFFKRTATVTRFDFMENTIRASIMPQVVISESAGSDSTLTTEFSLKYSVSQSSAVLQNNSVGKVTVTVPFESSEVSSDSFVVYSDVCPGGYGIKNVSNLGIQCYCLDQSVDKIVHCEDDQESVIIEDGYWVSTSVSMETHSHVMHFYTCPAGYCRCVQNSSVGINNCVYLYVNNEPDAQCSCNRHGVLCGSCEGQGVSALNDRCVSCGNGYVFLIPLLIVIQIALYVTIALADKKLLPSLYPITFYVQVIPYTAPYFHESFWTAGQFLYYLSSSISFYFPYDFCLYKNMDPLISYVLRYLPLLVAIVILPLTIIIRNTKWKRKLKHHGVWIIVLLIYTHTVHTSMSILNCPAITDKSGATLSRWFVNGDMVCFTGTHLPVAVISLFVLLLALLLIPIVAAIAAGKLQSVIGWEWTNHFQLPFLEGYKEKYKWWAAVELGRRLLFIFLTILFPRQQVAVLLLVCIVLAIYGFHQPYKDTLVNVVELLVDINFIVLLLFVSSNILEPYYSLSTKDMNTNMDCSPTSGIVIATWILLPVYYFSPLLLLIFVSRSLWRVLSIQIFSSSSFQAVASTVANTPNLTVPIYRYGRRQVASQVKFKSKKLYNLDVSSSSVHYETLDKVTGNEFALSEVVEQQDL